MTRRIPSRRLSPTILENGAPEDLHLKAERLLNSLLK
jgi:hypothetical protein